MSKNKGFRAWFYFRTGWISYFAFLFAAVNSIIVTYYLVIENIPTLKDIFPSLSYYLIWIIIIGIPLITLSGYFYYKKSPQFKTEADIRFESNPYWRRTLINSDVTLQTHSKLLESLIKKYSNYEFLTSEIKNISELKEELENHKKRNPLK
jgi:hypothetical protein